MGILGDIYPQPGAPPNPSLFPGDSVLGRMARGSYKPTDADLAELHKLARSGNRAERRAAARHLKKQGIATPPAAPRAPVVMPVVPATATGERAPAESAAPAKAQDRTAMKEPPKQAQASKQSPQSKASHDKAAGKEAAARKPSPKKTPRKKVAAKKAAPRKRAAGRAATKKTAMKKTAVKKASARKAPAKKTRRK
jgi:hypothetical protein